MLLSLHSIYRHSADPKFLYKFCKLGNVVIIYKKKTQFAFSASRNTKTIINLIYFRGIFVKVRHKTSRRLNYLIIYEKDNIRTN